MYCETLHIESAYGNVIVALKTQLCIPHLTVVTSPEIRHCKIKYLWIYQVNSSKKFILYFSTLFFVIVQALQWPALKVYSNKGIGIQGFGLCTFMLERSLNVIASPQQWINPLWYS